MAQHENDTKCIEGDGFALNPFIVCASWNGKAPKNLYPSAVLEGSRAEAEPNFLNLESQAGSPLHRASGLGALGTKASRTSAHSVQLREEKPPAPLGPSLDPNGEPPPNLEVQPTTKRRRSPSWVLPASPLSLKPVDQTCFAGTLDHNCCRKSDFGSTQVRMPRRGTDGEPQKTAFHHDCPHVPRLSHRTSYLFTLIKILFPDVQAHSQLHLAWKTLDLWATIESLGSTMLPAAPCQGGAKLARGGCPVLLLFIRQHKKNDPPLSASSSTKPTRVKLKFHASGSRIAPIATEEKLQLQLF